MEQLGDSYITARPTVTLTTQIHVIETGVSGPSNPSIHIYEDRRTSKVDRGHSGLFKRARPAPPSTSTIPFQFLEFDCLYELDQLWPKGPNTGIRDMSVHLYLGYIKMDKYLAVECGTLSRGSCV
jgi:hypothetical protein